MLYFSKVSKQKIINLERIAMVWVRDEVTEEGVKSEIRLEGGEWFSLNEEETEQLIQDMEHAATLYRIQQNEQYR